MFIGSLSSNILQPLYRSMLPKLGVNRNFPHAMIPVALVVGGLSLRSLEIEQGLE